MATFTVNPSRFDPYKNFKFRLKLDGRYVAGVTDAPALKVSTEVVEPASRKLPGLRKFGTVTLKGGITHDSEFESWANNAQAYGSGLGAEGSPQNVRRDIIIEVYDEEGQLALAYKLYRCWVSEFQAVPDLDANAVTIQSIKLENEGWERDYDIAKEVAPSSA